eukprot:EG_transcript_29519
MFGRGAPALQTADGHPLPSLADLLRQAQDHKRALSEEGKYPGNKYFVEDRYSRAMAVNTGKKVLLGCAGTWVAFQALALCGVLKSYRWSMVTYPFVIFGVMELDKKTILPQLAALPDSAVCEKVCPTVSRHRHLYEQGGLLTVEELDACEEWCRKRGLPLDPILAAATAPP